MEKRGGEAIATIARLIALSADTLCILF